MKLFYKYFIPALLFVCFNVPIKAQQIDFSRQNDLLSEKIHAGVKYYNYIYDSIPWRIHVLEVDIPNDSIRISAVKGMERIDKSREKLTSISERKTEDGSKVIAGINADFFHSNGDIVNNQISCMEIVKGIDSKRSQIAFNNLNEPSIGIYKFYGSISKTLSEKYIIDACNFRLGNDSIAIYNHYWTERGNGSGDILELTLRAIDTLKMDISTRAVIDLIDDDATIDKKSLVLSASGTKAEKLRQTVSKGDTVSITMGFRPGSGIKELLGGLPQIVRNGINISDEQTLTEGASEKFSTTRHPRTAMGYNREKTKLFLLVVDGRQRSSAGMSLNELSQFMIYLGCSDALNLDGGGSSTMIINNKIINSPSDLLGERSIGNALLLLTN